MCSGRAHLSLKTAPLDFPVPGASETDPLLFQPVGVSFLWLAMHTDPPNVTTPKVGPHLSRSLPWPYLNPQFRVWREPVQSRHLTNTCRKKMNSSWRPSRRIFVFFSNLFQLINKNVASSSYLLLIIPHSFGLLSFFNSEVLHFYELKYFLSWPLFFFWDGIDLHDLQY